MIPRRGNFSRVGLTGMLIVLFSISAVSARVYENAAQPKPFIIPGKVTVVFHDGVNIEKKSQSFGRVNFGIPTLDQIFDKAQASAATRIFNGKTTQFATASGTLDLSRYFEITVPEDQDIAALVEELKQNPNVKIAEPVWALPLLASPNDPSWPSQWAMEPAGPDPNFYTAWDTETGSDSIVYANIDSGTQYSHRDLEPNIWVNPEEDIDGDGAVYDLDDLNGIDEDGNGVIDDLIGYDFFTGLGGGVQAGEDAGVPDSDPKDWDGHGTHVAGIVAAANNNGLDVTGVAGGWYGGHRSYRGVRIMALRVGATGSDGNGYVNSNNCGTAIEYAAENGARVINCSWGSSGTATMIAGMAACASMGVTVCHAAGNDNADDPDYLDADPSTTVLSVASLGPSSDVRSSFSNYGTWVDVSAPGSSILSTYSNHYTATTATLSGTSMASPMVAGLAMLIRSAKPSLSKARVDSIITATADNIDASNPTFIGQLGTGRINAVSALAGLPIAKFTSSISDGNVPHMVNFTDASPGSPSAWKWYFGTGDSSTLQNPSFTYLNPGIYDVSLLTTTGNPFGPGEEHLKRYVWARADTIKIDSVQGVKGSNVVLPIRLHNTALVKEINFAFEVEGASGISYVSHDVTGLRTSYFSSVTIDGFESLSKVNIKLRSSGTGQSDYLTPDTGVVLKITFAIDSSAVTGVYVVDSATVAGTKKPNISTIYGDYWPIHIPGKIVVAGCCVGIRGNVNNIGGITVADLTYLVQYLFNEGAAPACTEEANVNGLSSITVADLTYLVQYLFNGGAQPPSCP